MNNNETNTVDTQQNEHDWAKLALSLMDLTSLGDHDTKGIIHSLCISASTPYGQAAAVCVYPEFVRYARYVLDENHAHHVKVATVTNFPHGNDDVRAAKKQTKKAIKIGADEVDVVFPYRALIAGNEKIAAKLVEKCKKKCKKHDVTLKVIIESGELQTPELIKKASEIAIENGADFIKTSTGKVHVNATLESAEIMLKTIRLSGKKVGFKAAGGVRTTEDAKKYLQLAESIMGKDWLCADNFRFGASGLLNNLLATLNDEQVNPSNDSY